MKNILLLGGLIAVVGIGAFVYMNKPQTQSDTMESDTTQVETGMPVREDGSTGPSGEMEVVRESGTTEETKDATTKDKEFTLEGTEFAFSRNEIRVKKGDTVTITLTNGGQYSHDWVIDEFSAKTKQINAGETDTISFVADKAGTFEYYCSVGKHRQQGMKGNLIVE